MEPTLHIDELKVGVFVHLDLSWMSHPFPLSSFKLTSQDQIDTLRRLGVQHVRYSPAQSEFDPRADATQAQRGELSSGLDASSALSAGAPAVPRGIDERAKRLAAQRDAVRRCERQFAEACREFKRAVERADADPLQAGEDALALTRSVVDKMLGEGELCVRALISVASDRSSAHAVNVAILSLLMGQMFELADGDLMDLGCGAMLHDIGKQDLPERVRHVDENSPSAEIDYYREHVGHGVVRVKRMGMSTAAQLVVAQHHERADGSGFPKSLTLESMSTGARIVSMINLYDRLCNAPLSSRSLTPHEALSCMFAQARSKFDSTMLNAFIRMMGIYPPGSLVQLTDDRYAMVMAVNSARSLKPAVMVYDPRHSADDALHLDLADAVDLGIRRSLRPQQLPPQALAFFQPRQRVNYFFERVNAPVETLA